ncbi:MAG: hypothetical protein H6737_08500 [Alphaproteobacteria bacterium]|nr:hypothetical protein [Alphaproteobacteria bacterium]
MAGIKVGAHPMVVAVAMGLLGPGALFDESDELENDRTSSSARENDEQIPEPPSAEEFARVEDLWHTVRCSV